MTGYIVQVDDGLGGDYVTVHNSLTTILILSGLESSRNYRIRYAARNIIFDADNMFDCDALQFSTYVIVLTAVVPSEPRNLIHDESLRYRNALVFKWEASATNGGSPL